MYEGCDFNEQTCPICGKKFCITHIDGWVYRTNRSNYRNAKRVFFCSWGCMRKAEAEAEKKKNRKKRKEQEP